MPLNNPTAVDVHDLRAGMRYVTNDECYVTVAAHENTKAVQHTLRQNGWTIVRAFYVDSTIPSLSAASIPHVTLYHSTCLDGPKGAIIHAIRHTTCLSIQHQGHTIGTCVERPEGREIFLMNPPSAKHDLISQADDIYALVDTILERHAFHPADIFRWWNYMTDIKTNYAYFNQARNAYFDVHHITPPYPAATGIENNLPHPLEISLSCEAIQGNNGAISVYPLRSAVQNEAPEYGPKFSRGMLVEDRARHLRKIYVSGTSHLDHHGQSVVTADPRDDVHRTLDSVRHLLEKSDATLDDIKWSLVYCKDVEAHQAFLDIYQEHQWRFPFVPVFVNVCRPELRFEMECFATTHIDA